MTAVPRFQPAMRYGNPYDPEGSAYAGMEADPGGEYVLEADYAQLHAQLTGLRAALAQCAAQVGCTCESAPFGLCAACDAALTPTEPTR